MEKTLQCISAASKETDSGDYTMRVLQVNSGQHLNGALVHTFLLSRELIALGHEVHVVCHPGFWLWEQCQQQGIPCCESSMRRRWSEIRRVRQYIQRHDLQVIHTHMSRAHFFGVLLRVAARIPCVATAHNCHFQLHWWWNDFVIANSEATRAYHIRTNRVPRDRIQTIYCTSDLTRFRTVDPTARADLRQKRGIADRQWVLGIVGEVTSRKGHHVLLEALTLLRRAVPDVQLWIVGRADRKSRYVRSLRRFVLTQGLAGCVRWCGRQANVPHWMAAMDAVVVPSLVEPLGLVALEAQAAGTPVIVSNVGGLPEIIQDGHNGLVTPVGNPSAIAEAVLRLKSEPAQRQMMVDNGWENIDRFDLTELSRQVATCLERQIRLASKSNSPRPQ